MMLRISLLSTLRFGERYIEHTVYLFPECTVTATASRVVFRRRRVYCSVPCIISAAPLLFSPPKWGLFSSLKFLIGCHCESPRRVSWRHATSTFLSLRIVRSSSYFDRSPWIFQWTILSLSVFLFTAAIVAALSTCMHRYGARVLCLCIEFFPETFHSGWAQRSIIPEWGSFMFSSL